MSRTTGETRSAHVDVDVDPEAALVRGWRLEELVRAGYSYADARVLADLPYVDLHQATALLRRGCRPDLALRILV